MKQQQTTDWCRKVKRAVLASVFLFPACVMAQDLPTMPAGGPDNGTFDEPGRYPAGSVNTISYYSSVAGRNVDMMVYTPSGYSTSQKYGVVYCYQGISTGIDTIFADWCVAAGIICDNLIGEGKISKGVIIVAVDDQFNGDYSDVQGMTINDVIPYIDSHYSTYADADHRGVYGFSWGGGYAFNVGCQNLNYFHHIGPSAAAPNKAGDDQLFPNGGAAFKALEKKTLFFSWGEVDYDSIKSAGWNTHNYCNANGIPHYYWEVAGQGHTAGVWRPSMWNFLQLADRGGISGGSTSVAGGTYKLLARHSGKAMDATGNGTSNGTQIEQWTYSGGANQKWSINSVGNGQYSIIGVQSGKCIDINAAATANGTKVQLWDYVGGSNQKFTFTATNGYFRVSPTHATGSCLDVSGNSTTDGALVQLWQWLGGNNQQWLLQPVDGTVKLVARHSNKAMDAFGAQTTNGTQIIQWTYGGGNNQKWTLTDTGSGNYKIIGVQSGKSLDIYNGQTSNGTKVELWDFWGGTMQQFKLAATAPGYFRITPNNATGSCLDVSGVSTADGANVQLWQWTGGNNQQWSPQAP